jgi:hypothetical protein
MARSLTLSQTRKVSSNMEEIPKTTDSKVQFDHVLTCVNAPAVALAPLAADVVVDDDGHDGRSHGDENLLISHELGSYVCKYLQKTSK